jgi:Tol biopolymer transport system component
MSMMRKRLWIACVLVGLLASTVPPAHAAFPGRNGRLTFTSWSKVWTARADGSDMTEILQQRRRPFNPQWSPDGSRIAYECGGGYGDICLMKADGSGNNRLTDTPDRSEGGVAWAPEGERLIFVRDTTLVIMDLATGEEDTIVAPLVNPHSPAWSPDGSKIAVTATGSGATDVFTMNVDGSEVTNLTNDRRYENDVDWSPDGTELVFSGSIEDRGWALQIISADGSSRREVTQGSVFEVSPSWSPNGRRIAFSAYDRVGQDGSLEGNQSIYTVRVDGSGMRNLFPNNKRGYYSPDWQPRP